MQSLYEEQIGTVESSEMPVISTTHKFLDNGNKDRSAIIRSTNNSSPVNMNFSDQRVCDFVKIPHRYNRSKNEAETDTGRIIKSSAPMENILKDEEQPNSLQVSIVNSTLDYNGRWEQNDNEDEVGIKTKTENNSPNAVGNSKKLEKSSNKHWKEAKTVNPIQRGKFKISKTQRKRIKDACPDQIYF